VGKSEVVVCVRSRRVERDVACVLWFAVGRGSAAQRVQRICWVLDDIPDANVSRVVPEVRHAKKGQDFGHDEMGRRERQRRYGDHKCQELLP
jgi:hypothetical protein